MRGSLSSQSYFVRNPTLAPQLEKTYETPQSLGDEGLHFMHSLERPGIHSLLCVSEKQTLSSATETLKPAHSSWCRKSSLSTAVGGGRDTRGDSRWGRGFGGAGLVGIKLKLDPKY